ncbi:hypothetical protein BKA81DRAFT_361929 [Phyllosticta paracitricarpa]
MKPYCYPAVPVFYLLLKKGAAVGEPEDVLGSALVVRVARQKTCNLNLTNPNLHVCSTSPSPSPSTAPKTSPRSIASVSERAVGDSTPAGRALTKLRSRREGAYHRGNPAWPPPRAFSDEEAPQLSPRSEDSHSLTSFKLCRSSLPGLSPSSLHPPRPSVAQESPVVRLVGLQLSFPCQHLFDTTFRHHGRQRSS